MTKNPPKQPPDEGRAEQRTARNHISADLDDAEWMRHVGSFYRKKSDNPGDFPSVVAECPIKSR